MTILKICTFNKATIVTSCCVLIHSMVKILKLPFRTQTKQQFPSLDHHSHNAVKRHFLTIRNQNKNITITSFRH